MRSSISWFVLGSQKILACCLSFVEGVYCLLFSDDLAHGLSIIPSPAVFQSHLRHCSATIHLNPLEALREHSGLQVEAGDTI